MITSKMKRISFLIDFGLVVVLLLLASFETPVSCCWLASPCLPACLPTVENSCFHYFDGFSAVGCLRAAAVVQRTNISMPKGTMVNVVNNI